MYASRHRRVHWFPLELDQEARSWSRLCMYNTNEYISVDCTLRSRNSKTKHITDAPTTRCLVGDEGHEGCADKTRLTDSD